MSTRLFPCVLMALQVCAAARWAAARDVGQTIVWVADAAITYAITFLMRAA